MWLLASALTATALAAQPALPISEAARAKLHEEKVASVVVCGSTQIQLTKKSLSKEWFDRKSGRALALADIPSYQAYRELLAQTSTEDLGEALSKHFGDVRLIVFPGREGAPILLHAEGVANHFQASVKDCKEKKLNLHTGKESVRPICDEKLPSVEVKFQAMPDASADYVLDYERGVLYTPKGQKRTSVTHCVLGERLALDGSKR